MQVRNGRFIHLLSIFFRFIPSVSLGSGHCNGPCVSHCPRGLRRPTRGRMLKRVIDRGSASTEGATRSDRMHG
ncbi:hypothetical protein C8Q74DRAFT_15152 [Fomes fomentarius]|nr:hypothetical protein C8Q74DRAFT_15152 [Fomes fomentarius]